MTKEATPFNFPEVWCSRKCKNSMNEICVTECAIAKDARHFELKEGLTIFDADDVDHERLKEMKPQARLIYLAVNLKLIMDHLKGDENGYQRLQRPKTPPNREGSSGVIDPIKPPDVQDDDLRANTLRQDLTQTDSTTPQGS